MNNKSSGVVIRPAKTEQPNGSFKDLTKIENNDQITKSHIKLMQLRFDPMERLIQKYTELEIELKRQVKIRDGEIVELTSNGKPRAYRAEVHYSIFDKQVMIAEKLMRYAYGRVPEAINNEQTITQPLVINLTKEGEVYTLNDQSDISQDNSKDNYEDTLDKNINDILNEKDHD